MGLGKSSTGLSGWGYGGARSTVRLCRVILIIMAGAAPWKDLPGRGLQSAVDRLCMEAFTKVCRYSISLQLREVIAPAALSRL